MTGAFASRVGPFAKDQALPRRTCPYTLSPEQVYNDNKQTDRELTTKASHLTSGISQKV